MAAEMAGMEGRPAVVRKERRRVSVFDFFEEKMNPMKGLLGSGPRLEYRLR